jgi:hypothetical protein
MHCTQQTLSALTILFALVACGDTEVLVNEVFMHPTCQYMVEVIIVRYHSAYVVITSYATNGSLKSITTLQSSSCKQHALQAC